MKENIIKFVIFAVLYFVDSFFATSWPMFRFDYKRTGFKYEIAIPSPIPAGWSLRIQGKIISSPIVKDDKVFITARDNSIFVLDAYTGEILWQYSTSGPIDASAVIWKSNLYVLSYDGNLYCFTSSQNSSEDLYNVSWVYSTKSRSASTPIVIDDEEVIGKDNNPWVIFVSGPRQDGNTNGKLYILDALTGELINSIDLGSFSYSSLSYSEGKVYLTTNNGILQCYDLKQNKFLWQKSFLSSFYFSCVTIRDDYIFLYAGDIERKAYMLDKNTGKVLWVSQQLSDTATDNTSLSVTEDKIFVNIYPTSLWKQNGIVCSSQTVICISTTTGIIWRKDFFIEKSPKDSYGLSSAISVVGTIAFFGTYSGDLLAVDIEDGSILRKYNFNSPIVNSVAVANGFLYFAEINGNFYGIELEKFISIKRPDIDEVVIDFSTVTILSKKYDGKKYNLEYFEPSSSQWIAISTGVFANINTYSWDTKFLLDGKYAIRLISESGEYLIHEFTIDNSPLPPSSISAFRVDNNKIMLSWTKSLDDEAGNNDVRKYKIYISTDSKTFKVLTYIPKGTTFYIDTQIPGSTYYYKISALDKNSETSNPFYAYVYLPVISKPKAPLNFQILNYTLFISSAIIELSWSKSIDESTNVVAYNLYYSSNNINFLLKDRIFKTSNTTYYYSLHLVSGLTHYFYLTAENQYGIESEKTDILSIFIPNVTKPTPPRNVTAFDTPNDISGNITLMWLYSVDEENTLSKVVGYKIYKSSDNIYFLSLYYTYNVNKTTYIFIDTNCPEGVTFYYYITSVNQHGLESNPSQIVFAYSISDSTSQPDIVAPLPPKNLTAVDYPFDDGTKILLNWQLSDDDGGGFDDVVLYKIYRSTDSAVYTTIANLPSSTTFYIDSQLIPNLTYYYYITAIDKYQNESLPSNYLIVVAVPDGIPKPPTNFKVYTKTTYDRVVSILNWDKSQDDNYILDKISYYIIYKSSISDSEGFYVLTQLSKNTTFYEDLTCEPDTEYYYYISCLSKYGYESEPTQLVKIYTKYEIYVKEEELPVVLRYKKQLNLIEIYLQKGTIKNKTLGIEIVQQYPQLPQQFKSLPSVYNLYPSDIKFSLPAKLKIYYNTTLLPNIDKNKLRVYYYDTYISSWRMLNTSNVNLQQGYVEADIYNGGLYTIAEYLPLTQEILKDEYVYAFPSPAKGDEVYFKFLLYQPAKIKVSVYDILGNIIWQSDEKVYTESDIGKVHIIKWDIRKISTGMYIFKLEAKNENSKKIVTKKFTIIH